MIEVIRKDGKVGQIILQNDMLIYRPEKGVNIGICYQSIEDLTVKIYKIGNKVIGKGKDWREFCKKLSEEGLLRKELKNIPDELYVSMGA